MEITWSTKFCHFCWNDWLIKSQTFKPNIYIKILIRKDKFYEYMIVLFSVKHKFTISSGKNVWDGKKVVENGITLKWQRNVIKTEYFC